MFRVHTHIIRSIRRWVAPCGFLHRVFKWVVVLRAAVYGADVNVRVAPPSAPHTRPTQRLSRPPPIQKLGAENHILRLNIQCSWWCAYVPETCRTKNTLIKLPCCIKLAFQIISWERCAVKKTSDCDAKSAVTGTWHTLIRSAFFVRLKSTNLLGNETLPVLRSIVMKNS